MSPSSPHYIFEGFRIACGKNRKDIFIWGQALENAAKDFKLKSKNAVLDFIYNHGLENMVFMNCTPFRYRPDILVDAYEFTSLCKKGYIAFFYNQDEKIWNIKSFCLSVSMNLVMQNAFEKAGIIPKLKD